MRSVDGLADADVERFIQEYQAEIARLRAECKTLQAELDRRARAKKVTEEAQRISRMTPAERLALLQAIGATQVVDASPVGMSSSVP